MVGQLWFRYLAGAAVFTFAALGIGPGFPTVAQFSFAIGFVLAMVALGYGIAPLLRKKDPYDLGELKRVHDDEELRAIELDLDDALGTPEKVICPNCHTDYPFRARACPRCGASR